MNNAPPTDDPMFVFRVLCDMVAVHVSLIATAPPCLAALLVAVEFDVNIMTLDPLQYMPPPNEVPVAVLFEISTPNIDTDASCTNKHPPAFQAVDNVDCNADDDWHVELNNDNLLSV